MTVLRRRTRAAGLAAAIAAVALLALPGLARADAVRDWNLNATTALAAQDVRVSVLHLAMVHGAVYDAVNAIDRGHRPYLVAPRAKPSDSPDAAAATAAYRVLVSIVPDQKAALEALYVSSLAAIPDGPAKTGGIHAGETAAAAMIAERTNDGRFGTPGFPVGTLPGQWRPVLPLFVNDPNAWIANVTPFLINNASQCRSRGPYPLTSRKYAAEFAEVKAVGSATSTTRTADQTHAARYWAENPPGTWTRIARMLSQRAGLSVVDNARYFAMLYLTQADAIIGVWDDKARWLFWRPITAIREAATDGNPKTEADAEWLPLIPTPPYPDHSSGHSALSASTVRTLQQFFGTDGPGFSDTNNAGLTRSFPSFSAAIDEVIDARVWSGIHFRLADEQGARIGRKVANWRQHHYFQPVHDVRADADKHHD
jgi:hypothetical protein